MKSDAHRSWLCRRGRREHHPEAAAVCRLHRQSATQRGVVYIDEIDKITREKSDTPSIISATFFGEGVQQALLEAHGGHDRECATAGRGASIRAAGIPAGRPSSPISYLSAAARLTGLEKIISARSRPGSIGFGARVITPEDEGNRARYFGRSRPEDLLKYGLIPRICRLAAFRSSRRLRISTRPRSSSF